MTVRGGDSQGEGDEQVSATAVSSMCKESWISGNAGRSTLDEKLQIIMSTW
jgi:hypothetical protein